MRTITASTERWDLRALVSSARRQPLSFWAVCSYVFFEYVRPQTLYSALDVLPYAWISLLVAVLASILESNGVRKWTSVDIGMLSFSLVLLASLLTAYNRAAGLNSLTVYLNWVLVYLIITATLNSERRFVLFLLSWMLWNLKMSLFAVRSWASIGFQFRSWGVGGAPGWFQNSGEFGIEMCIFFPLSLYFALGVRPYISRSRFLLLLILPTTALLGAIASSSRGALLGMVGVGVWMLLRSERKAKSLAVLAIAGAIFVTLIPSEQWDRISNAGSDATSISRMTYWENGIEIANDHPLLGVGYGSWISYYSTYYPPPAQLPHNIFIEAVAELGYTGLLSLLAMIVATFALNHKSRLLARRLGAAGRVSHHIALGLDGAMIGFMVSGSFVTVLYYPYLWMNLALIAALHLSVRRSYRSFSRENNKRNKSLHVGVAAPQLGGA